jgi:hypothetical protein
MILQGATAAAALACAVCFGEPGAPMTQGAMAGVLVLAGLIVSVLIWIVVVVRFMLRRARAVQAQDGTPPIGPAGMGQGGGLATGG